MSEVQNLIDNAMINMIVDFETLAALVTRLGIEVVNDKTKPYAAWTDGQSIFLNEYAITEMNKMKTDTDSNGNTHNVEITSKELIFVIAHELMHILNETNERGNRMGILFDDVSPSGKAKHELWNIATDYEINSLLYFNVNLNSDSNKSISKSVGHKPDWVMFDAKYKDVPAEDIYKELLEQTGMSGGNKGKNGNYSFSVRDGNGMTFTFDPNNDDSNSGNGGQSDGQDNQDGQNSQDTSNSKGNNSSNDQSDQEQQNNQNQKGNSKPKNGTGLRFGLGANVPMIDEMTKAEIKAKIGDALQNSSSSSKGIGTGMSAFNRLLDMLFKPQPFDWRRALTRYIKSFMKENYTWNKPSRAGIANGLILPSASTTPKLHVAIAVDTSGSIGDRELTLLMNHVFTILSQFRTFTVDLWCCSTHVHEDTFTVYTSANKSKINQFKIQSDGGTDMSANFPFIEKKYQGRDKPDLLMIFTDGEDRLSGDETTRTKYPVLWLIVDNKEFKKPKYIPGEAYYFNTKDM